MEKPSSERMKDPISKNRLEFLFDGIFAIAMTILVLELKVPELEDRHSVGELWRKLSHHAPAFISYLLSFVMLGNFWHHHNRHFRHFRRITLGMLGLSFVQMASAAFFPFCAALMGRYPTNPLSTAIYIGCVMVYMLASMFLWLTAEKADAFTRDLAPAEYRKARRQNLIVCTIITLMFGLYLMNALIH
jgi:uncharacterized membrane protein